MGSGPGPDGGEWPERLPVHIAIIMDGNGRWASKNRRPRHEGHRKGIVSARETIETCGNLGIRYLTLFAFSSENWRRPSGEIDMLIELFVESLREFGDDLRRNKVRARFLGELGVFPERLQEAMRSTEEATAANRELNLGIAVNYGGRWDIVNAMRRLAESGADLSEVGPERLSTRLSTAYAPDPDLLIRTGGEVRISNFMLWQLAYTELYFCETLWPDFSRDELRASLWAFAGRDRRFGTVGDA